MEPIKLLHTADIHIGMENYGRVDPGAGVHARVMDFLRRLDDMVAYAVEQEVDVFVFAGDAYRTRDPNATHQREFAHRIKKLADAGIPVVMVVGNHDLPAVARRATSIDIFDALDVPKVAVGNRPELRTIECRRGQPLQVAFVPYPLRSAHAAREEHRGRSLAELDDLLRQRMIENVEALAELARARPDTPAILVGHFSVNEASHGSEQNIMIGRDAALPRSLLVDPVWRYVALGHIHKHQNLNPSNDPPVIYSGSIERIDFGEEREPKGFVVAELSDGPTTWQFLSGYRREARPFVTVRADVRDREDPTRAVIEAIAARSDLSEAVVRVLIRLREDQEPLLADREVQRALEGAYFVGALQKDVERSERQRLGDVSVEALTPAELLARYLQVKDVPAERRKLLLEHGEALIRAVDAA